MTAKLALFDCDGTMVDSQANICAAMDGAFAAHGLTPPDHHHTRRIVGLSLQEAVRQLLPDHDPDLVADVAESYKNGFMDLRQVGAVQEPLYDGLLPLIDRLRADDWLLGVATGKSDRGLQRCLEVHSIADRFITLQTADRHPSKPHPSMIDLAMQEAGSAPQTTVMIGDTSFDMEMGFNAGVRSIGVNWGYHEAQELTDAGAEIVVTTMDELYQQLTG